MVAEADQLERARASVMTPDDINQPPGDERCSATSGSSGRDLRIDFFRGLALWMIFTDHIVGNRPA
jgi:hypothetical protein